MGQGCGRPLAIAAPLPPTNAGPCMHQVIGPRGCLPLPLAGAMTPMSRTCASLLLLALAVLLVASPAGAGDGTDPGAAQAPCAVVQVTPWAPYVSIHPECLGPSPADRQGSL